MKKNRLTRFFVALILLALVGIFIVAVWLVRNPASMTTQTQNEPVTHPVLVVDFNNDGIINEDELMRGQDAILAVRTHNKANQDELFNSVAALENIDLNKDNQIDPEHDPIFPRLELIFLTDQGKGRKTISLTQAGIKAIAIYPQRLRLPQESIVNNLAGEAIMTDGSKRTIRLLKVNVGE